MKDFKKTIKAIEKMELKKIIPKKTLSLFLNFKYKND